MAYRPSRRQTRKANEALEPNMTPIMNLMVVLIPLLLSSVELIKMSVIELNLPPNVPNQLTSTEEPELLDLALTITDEGFYISSAAAILASDDGKPSIPKKDGEYDYELLAEKLYEIKGKAGNRFEDSTSITIQAEPKINYQTLVSTMDAARSIRLDGQDVMLFPHASVSAGIL